MKKLAIIVIVCLVLTACSMQISPDGAKAVIIDGKSIIEIIQAK